MYKIKHKYILTHPNAVSQIGSKKYQYDPNGNPLVIEDSAFYRRMLWDEENRLALLSDNGNGNNYIYDHSGERVIKRQTSLQSVYIDGMPVGMTVNTKNATVYVSSNFVVKNHGFTKHYYAGTERVLSKIGIGEFNNHFSPTNQIITAGNKNYIQRQGQLNQGLNDYYLQLQIPPGNPTQPNALGQPEVTGNPLPTIVGDYTIPRGWPQQPYFNPPGGPPGPPAQWGDPITNDNVTAGYGYLSNGLEERDLYFYHPDHLGSTSIITDRNGVATQFVAYMPFGESFVDEHTSSWESPYKFSGKERDEETGLIYFGSRYYDPKAGIWFGVDPLAEKYPSVGGYVYTMNNPIKLIDPNGEEVYEFDESGKYIQTSGEKGSSDQFQINKADGNTVLSKEYENGTITKDFTAFVQQGDGKNVDVDFMKIKGDKNAKESFEFMANNTNVEWSWIGVGTKSGDDGKNYLSSSQEKGGENSINTLLNNETATNNNIRQYTHNHPSGYNQPSNDDVNSRKVLQSIYPNIQLNIYSKERGYRSYTTIKDMIRFNPNDYWKTR